MAEIRTETINKSLIHLPLSHHTSEQMSPHTPPLVQLMVYILISKIEKPLIIIQKSYLMNVVIINCMVGTIMPPPRDNPYCIVLQCVIILMSVYCNSDSVQCLASAISRKKSSKTGKDFIAVFFNVLFCRVNLYPISVKKNSNLFLDQFVKAYLHQLSFLGYKMTLCHL